MMPAFQFAKRNIHQNFAIALQMAWLAQREEFSIQPFAFLGVIQNKTLQTRHPSHV